MYPWRVPSIIEMEMKFTFLFVSLKVNNMDLDLEKYLTEAMTIKRNLFVIEKNLILRELFSKLLSVLQIMVQQDWMMILMLVHIRDVQNQIETDNPNRKKD